VGIRYNNINYILAQNIFLVLQNKLAVSYETSIIVCKNYSPQEANCSFFMIAIAIQGRSEGYVLGGGPRSLFADKVGVAEAWHGCGLGAVYDNDLIFL
jgi:hypothetical protein